MSKATILLRILQRKREEVAERSRVRDLAQLRDLARDASPVRGFADALGKRRGPNAAKAADIIALNAGAAIYVSGITDSVRRGVGLALDMIQSGLALERIEALASFCACLENE